METVVETVHAAPVTETVKEQVTETVHMVATETLKETVLATTVETSIERLTETQVSHVTVNSLPAINTKNCRTDVFIGRCHHRDDRSNDNRPDSNGPPHRYSNRRDDLQCHRDRNLHSASCANPNR